MLNSIIYLINCLGVIRHKQCPGADGLRLWLGSIHVDHLHLGGWEYNLLCNHALIDRSWFGSADRGGLHFVVSISHHTADAHLG